MDRRFDQIASIIFFVLGIGFMYESRQISKTAYGSAVGPDIFPFVLGLILLLLSARLFYETFRYQQHKQAGFYDYKRFFIILGTTVMYIAFLESVGYVISTFLFLLITFQTMQAGKWIQSILISSAFSFGVYFIFVDVLKGSMPGWPVWLGM
ncbi:tripartite tricarboxylate transporter TctB family protein [Bacillus sp. 165]|uniref:tripartite tricarboxylate transporter TctB family protein n=1 Tax=Bacillus sp. 165 TaxID=1529117 RepID=UPI001AD96A68|nr:tripartite tricarboxylate transporter TctB family protein [Bacillus sp. 165]MBO9128795.1 tripartite tricarboxylate transporter TctB family protein [Bacillus sp. 165]